MSQASSSTLYDRLGGEEAVAATVDEFYTRVIGDPTLSPFFEGTNMDRLKMHQRQFLKFAFSAVPEGMDVPAYLTKAHKRLFETKGLNEKHFDLVAGHLVDALVALGIQKQLIDECVGVVGPLRTVFEQGALNYRQSQDVNAE